MSSDLFDLVARACRPANVVELPRRTCAASDEHPHVYTEVLLRDDVTIGQLAHALRFTDIVVTTDPASGQTVIHRNASKPAA